jgi:hypothetical protein
VLDYITAHVLVDELGDFYEDPETGEAFSVKDQQRLRAAWLEFRSHLSKRSHRLAKSLKVEAGRG